MHATIASAAMDLGKHVYVQKPLTWSVEEARLLAKKAKDKKVATQMGNQGSAGSGLRRAVEVIQAGLVGKPLELHVWSNRPIWPQGIDRPEGEDPVPPTLDWNFWIGPAPMRPYKENPPTADNEGRRRRGSGIYHPFAWRGWKDFGTGALGDMACHTVNMPFRALKLGYPNVVECEETSELYQETYPKTSRSTSCGLRSASPLTGTRNSSSSAKFYMSRTAPAAHSGEAWISVECAERRKSIGCRATQALIRPGGKTALGKKSSHRLEKRDAAHRSLSLATCKSGTFYGPWC